MKYDIKVIRTSRKSISLSVSPENEIVVRCPRGISESRLNSFIDSKRCWLNKVVAQNEVKISSNRSIIEFKEIYVEGVKLPLIMSDKNEITSESVYIKSLKNVKNLFISEFADEFIRRAKNISEEVGLTANSFSVRSYKARWGCCDSKGNIKFNYLLFMLPVNLQRYVIIHELCHTVFLNHSPEFWRLVARFEPDYKNLRRQLKSYDFITNLY